MLSDRFCQRAGLLGCGMHAGRRVAADPGEVACPGGQGQREVDREAATLGQVGGGVEGRDRIGVPGGGVEHAEVAVRGTAEGDELVGHEVEPTMLGHPWAQPAQGLRVVEEDRGLNEVSH